MDKQFLRAKSVARMIRSYIESGHGEKPAGLETWLAESDEHRAFFDRLLSGEKINESLDFYDTVYIVNEWRSYTKKHLPTVNRRRSAIRWVSGIAASLLVVTGITFLLTEHSEDPVVQVVTGENIYPGERKAVFAVGEMEIGITSGVNIRNENGTVIVDAQGRQLYASHAQSLNVHQRIIVPRGGEYDMTLSDGSKIWLNSETELTYPEKFDPLFREITVRGEAYLEVAQNTDIPFYVNIDNMRVRVLGTSFVVNNYANEDNITVSLISGCVRLETPLGDKLTQLSPAERFTMNRSTETVSLSGFDKQSLMDWKNNLFIFKNEDLASIARRLERWYDLEIEVEQTLRANRYSGIIDRHSNLQPVIFILTNTNEMEILETKEGKIVIQPRH